MDVGALTSGLLTGLREGVEAALIVGIILAYLGRTGNARHFGKIWIGAGVAGAVSLALGVVLYLTLGGLREPYEQIFEGTAMLLAAAVVTWMLFWMRRQAASVRGDLQHRVDRVLTEGTVWGLAVLAFTAVIREGIETSLFLVGQVTAAAQNGASGSISVLVGALLGLFAAAAIGYALYRGSRRLNLARFFRWTGIALIFIAAGLLSHAVHEFVEIGVISLGTQTAYDISHVLPHETGIGQFLRALFGYSANPEVATVLAYVA
ncbi:MAG: FTR1 family protein, partial [Chloroflexota bacterium]|nr:FTR1 family protein [Chloroflexota bacterium]